MRTQIVCLVSAVMLAAMGVGVFGQIVVIRDAPEVKFPFNTDSNSPAHWDDDTMYIFNSQGHPYRSHGADQFSLGDTLKTQYDNKVNGGRWVECTWKAKDGTLYGWYHKEPGGLCPGTHLTAPQIGAVKSIDNGANWVDLGVVLEARPDTLNCKAKNGFFAGGNGDFSCMLDHDGKYMYLFFSAYAGSVVEQGTAVARMLWKERNAPVGKVWKYFEGGWTEPGVGGRLSPVYPAKVDWKRRNADAFWGPSVHWNTHLKTYVMLLNHVCCRPGWPQEAVYVTYLRDLSDPRSWTQPKKILDGGSWYPQILGVNKAAKETDKLCGRQARFYLHGTSRHEILFLRDGEDASTLPATYQPKAKP